MMKLESTLFAALVAGLSMLGCGETAAPAPEPTSATASATPEPDPEPSSEIEPSAEETAEAEDVEGDDDPLVPVDFEEDSIEGVTAENIDARVEELEAALADVDLEADEPADGE